jgi:HTH-type transcriptional regulator, sugar sensing transcriptional regulator
MTRTLIGAKAAFSFVDPVPHYRTILRYRYPKVNSSFGDMSDKNSRIFMQIDCVFDRVENPRDGGMKQDRAEVRYQRFCKGLQGVGLNANESRCYLVLLGHSRFKALDLAPRSHIPRQKIYQVLGSLVDKGFASVVQDRTKLFSAVQPSVAIPAYLARKRQLLEHELTDQARSANGLLEDLSGLYSEGKSGRGTLDFLRIVSEPAQTAAEYQRMLAEVKVEYLEFSRPPYAVDPLDENLVTQARGNGVSCRLLIETGTLDAKHRRGLIDFALAGVEIRQAPSLPMKLACFDGRGGLIALLDPVISRPTWTSLVFDHAGLGEAMKHLFEDRWQQAAEFSEQAFSEQAIV